MTNTGAHRTAAKRISLVNAVPLIAQLHGYSKRALGRDAVAALSVAATLVPQALAYGQVAGLTPAAGLYTAVGAALAFSLVTSTRVVAVVPSSTLAIMTFEAVHGPAAGDPWGCCVSRRRCCGCKGYPSCSPSRFCWAFWRGRRWSSSPDRSAS